MSFMEKKQWKKQIDRPVSKKFEIWGLKHCGQLKYITIVLQCAGIQDNLVK